MITFKRTFHPVGQGAFFTEQFFNETGDKLLYNVVYDCGSLSDGIKKQMERTIENCLHDKKEIDILFLSHFDNDHVNYVRYLEEKGHLKGTKVFIPLLENEDWLSITPYKEGYGFVLSLNDKGAKVIKVTSDSWDLDPDYTRISDIDGDTISGNKKICPDLLYDSSNKPIWFYIPINARFESLIDDFKKALSDANLSYDDLKDEAYVFNNQEKLKHIYQGLGKKEAGSTPINLNSLLVMSMPASPNNWDYYRWDRHPFFYRRLYWGSPGSCLYTGDTSVRDATVWNKISSVINQCIASKERLHLIQIPHHGSKYCYDDNFLQSDLFSNGFTNYDPIYKQHIFDENLPMRLMINDKGFIGITREFASQYEEYLKMNI